jgi:hypothetical protein
MSRLLHTEIFPEDPFAGAVRESFGEGTELVGQSANLPSELAQLAVRFPLRITETPHAGLQLFIGHWGIVVMSLTHWQDARNAP